MLIQNLEESSWTKGAYSLFAADVANYMAKVVQVFGDIEAYRSRSQI